MRKKVMDLNLDGFHLIVIRCDNEKHDFRKFRIYRVTANHRKQIARYGDLLSVLGFIRLLYLEGMHGVPLNELAEWARGIGGMA